MKKLVLVLVLSLLCTPFFSVTSIAAESSDITLKRLEYEDKKKNPWGAVAFSWFIPSAGHAYAGDWGRGAKFLGLEVLEIALISYGMQETTETRNTYYGKVTETEYKNEGIASLATLALVGTRLWEYFDAYDTAEDYNEKLKQRLDLMPSLKIDKKGKLGVYVSHAF